MFETDPRGLIGVFSVFVCYCFRDGKRERGRKKLHVPSVCFQVCVYVCVCVYLCVMYKYISTGFKVALRCSVFRGSLVKSPLTPFMWLTLCLSLSLPLHTSAESFISSIFILLTPSSHHQTASQLSYCKSLSQGRTISTYSARRQ